MGKHSKTVPNVINYFKNASEHVITGMENLAGMVDNIRAATVHISKPTMTSSGIYVIGSGKQLSADEYTAKCFAISSSSKHISLSSEKIAKMLKVIKTNDVDEFVRNRITVTRDLPGVIYEDHAGNRVISFADGIGSISVSLSIIADLNTAYENVKGAIRTQLNENQALAIASLVTSIGEEKFLSSTVLAALNSKNYADVPRQIMGWVLDASGKHSTLLSGQRKFEASLFQSPDEMGSKAVMDDYVPGSNSYLELSQTLDIKRRDLINHKIK